MTPRSFVAAALASIALSALAEGLAPPPGWGKPQPPPPANGTGQATFKQGDLPFRLPLNKIEFQELSKNPPLQLVSLEFVDATNENQFFLSFTTQGKAGKVDDSFVSGTTAITKAGGVSKANVRQTRCDLVVTTLTAREVAGTASCAPMFKMDATSPAKPLTAITFSARAN